MESLRNLFATLTPYWWLIVAIVVVLVILRDQHNIDKGRQMEREAVMREKNAHKKRLYFLKTSCPLSKKNKAHPRVLKLLSGTEQISEITVTRFTLWNAGIDPVTQEDVDSENGIRIVKAENVTILGLEAICTKNVPALEFLFRPAGNITIGFQSMQANCGIIIQVMSLGNSNGVKLEGKLKENGVFKQAQSLDNAPSSLREFADIAHIK